MAYLVKSLVNLRREIDARWPSRDRRTDGWYRDPKVGISYGHNPDAKGAVHAIDVDKDGINPDWIISHIHRGDGTLWYIIWNRRLWSMTHDWHPYDYHGVSPHTDHMHIEVYHTSRGESYDGAWNVAPPPTQSFGEAPGVETQWGIADPLALMRQSAAYMVDSAGRVDGYARGIRDLRTQ